MNTYLSSPQNALARRTVALISTALLAFIIAYLTLKPQPTPLGSSGLDKVYHFTAFAALVFPAALFYARSLVWMIPAALVFGGAIELIQPYVERSREAADFLADTLGVAVGAAFGLAMRAAATRRQERATRGG